MIIITNTTRNPNGISRKYPQLEYSVQLILPLCSGDLVSGVGDLMDQLDVVSINFDGVAVDKEL